MENKIKFDLNNMQFRETYKIIILMGVILFYSCSRVSFVRHDSYQLQQSKSYTKDLTVPGTKGYLGSKTRNGWKLVWNDEFHGPEIDISKWSFYVGESEFNKDELQTYTSDPQNAYCTDGYLVLKATLDENKKYLSARIHSNKKFDVKYGRVDIRAYFPLATGTRSTLNLMPSSGPKREKQEITIADGNGKSPQVVISALQYPSALDNNGIRFNETALGEEPKFHLYSIEWDENQIQWLIDDKVVLSESINEEELKKLFSENFYLNMSLAVGGFWVGSPRDEKQFPARMYIDYVRVYQK
jgi:beta-glucanase (GH16 family)